MGRPVVHGRGRGPRAEIKDTIPDLQALAEVEAPADLEAAIRPSETLRDLEAELEHTTKTLTAGGGTIGWRGLGSSMPETESAGHVAVPHPPPIGPYADPGRFRIIEAGWDSTVIHTDPRCSTHLQARTPTPCWPARKRVTILSSAIPASGPPQAAFPENEAR